MGNLTGFCSTYTDFGGKSAHYSNKILIGVFIINIQF